MDKQQMIQMTLVKRTENGRRKQVTTWVDYDKSLLEGNQVTLKGYDGCWKIYKIYKAIQPRMVIESNRGWDNNNYDKHDGTALKTRVKK